MAFRHFDGGTSLENSSSFGSPGMFYTISYQDCLFEDVLDRMPSFGVAGRPDWDGFDTFLTFMFFFLKVTDVQQK